MIYIKDKSIVTQEPITSDTAKCATRRLVRVRCGPHYCRGCANGGFEIIWIYLNGKMAFKIFLATDIVRIFKATLTVKCHECAKFYWEIPKFYGQLLEILGIHNKIEQKNMPVATEMCPWLLNL